MDNKNWLHLDFKGIVPSERKICEWLDFFRECGFERVIFEYDCRVQWDCWPNAADPRLTKDEVRRITAHAEGIGMEVIPLVQIHGHLDWLLKHEQYAHLRENGFVNELCPQHPDASALIMAWIDEVLELHPNIHYIHLGADETWHLCTCEKCLEIVERDPVRGKMGVYLDHVGGICRHVIARGLRPMIWADMFCTEGRTDLARELPSETILVNWQYTGGGPYRTTAELKTSGLEVYGASAIQCAWYEHWWCAVNNPAMRLENVLSWNQSGFNVIHTTWGRPGNLWNLYPAWHGSVGIFIAAADPGRWSKHPWKPFFDRLGPALLRSWPHELKPLIEEVKTLPVSGSIEEEGRKWLELGLRYQLMVKNYLGVELGKKCMKVTRRYIGYDPASYRKYYETPLEVLASELAEWTVEMREFFQRNELSDMDEFVEEKAAIFG
jgi:hypothetical protein